MDMHHLTPLFSPQSIVIFAGDPEATGTDAQTAHAKLLVRQLKEGGYAGPVRFLDINMRGTLADLAQSRVDLAVIALPSAQLAAALEVTGRIQCKAALIVSSGVDAILAADLHAIARLHGIHLLGPNCLGFQRPKAGINASVLGAMAKTGSLSLVSQSGALTASVLDWADKNGIGFASVVSLGAVVGGVVGGLLGNQVGGGTGKAVATVAGVVGGALAGNQIEQNNRAQTRDMYQIRVRLENGGYQTIVQDSIADLRIGNRVRIEGDRVYRY
jgi:hypothetical protein